MILRHNAYLLNTSQLSMVHTTLLEDVSHTLQRQSQNTNVYETMFFLLSL